MAAILAFSLFDGVRIHASTARDIRVGLTSLYGKKDIITIYNEQLAIGYCKDNSFTAFGTLRSSAGFSFEPARDAWQIGSTAYDSYNNALKVCNDLKSSGFKALPCLYAENEWRVYIRIPDGASITGDLSAYGSEYRDSTSVRAVSNRTVIHAEASGYEFLIDGYIGGYPQFKAINSKGEQVPVSLGTRKYRGSGNP